MSAALRLRKVSNKLSRFSPTARAYTLNLPFCEDDSSDLRTLAIAPSELAESSGHAAPTGPTESTGPAASEASAIAIDDNCHDPRHSKDSPTALQSQAVEAEQARQALVAQLSREVRHIETERRMGASDIPDAQAQRQALFSTGCAEADHCLPHGGYDAGTIVEYLQSSTQCGAISLALIAAREALHSTDRACLFVDWQQQFYPPAASALGIDLKRLIIVRPQTLAERLWAIDQALRSSAIVAVIAEIEHIDDRSARRLQLAAERGGGVGLLVRGEAARHQPSWAEIQWLVQATPAQKITAHRQLALELMRVRGGRPGAQLKLQIHATHARLEASTLESASPSKSPAQLTLANTLARHSTPKRLAQVS